LHRSRNPEQFSRPLPQGGIVSLVLLWALCARAGAADFATAPKDTETPIHHLVIIFQENVSFDHYFATYPIAANPPGEPRFIPRPGTPSINGLTEGLLTHNPNSAAPFRLGRSQAATCDQEHAYAAEQRAFDAGLMDRFVESTGSSAPGCDPKEVMGYFDGNTVTALWNYAQHFAMSDNFYETTFGPSTLGALNLVSGQTHGATPPDLPGGVTGGTVMGDVQPSLDDCSKPGGIVMDGMNIGVLLNQKGITWGWFQGGFRPSGRTDSGQAICDASHPGSNGPKKRDYLPHHEPFQYYRSTANPHHLPPASAAAVGKSDSAHHQYDLDDFWNAVSANNLPAVSFLKAPAYQDGHAGYSDPLAEQRFVVETVNRLQKLSPWKEMAILITYDDSDGWYDHALGPIMNASSLPAYDLLSGPGRCGVPSPESYPGRCGYGPRLPLILISPFAKVNFVDHSVTDQTSILRFIEDNWRVGEIGDQSFDQKSGKIDHLFDFASTSHPGPLFLDPRTGQPLDGPERR